MLTISQLLLLVLLLNIFVSTVDCYSNTLQIYIDSVNGKDEPSCLNNSSEIACETPIYAFTNATSFTSYIFSANEDHNLTAEHTFANLQGLSFVGNNSIILCESGVGLAFVNVSGVYLDGISLLYCAATRNSTSKDFNSHLDPKPMNTFKVGLYFYLCEHVAMTQVNVSSSPGATGVVMYDTGGTNTVENCTFSNNTVMRGSKEAGGGGFYVEFTYCTPGDSECTDHVVQHPSVSNSSYFFADSYFIGNIADNEGLHSNSNFLVPYKSNHESFGRGGGLCIYIKGSASSNVFSLQNCHFENNTAQWGGGVFLELHDETANNSITFLSSTFVLNKCGYTLKAGTGGGGMRMGHYVFGLNGSSPSNPSSNQITLFDCNFTSNSAMYGGGLSISPALQQTGTTKLGVACIEIFGVLFHSNIGKFGSGLHVSRFHLVTEGVMLRIMLDGVHFINNSALYANFIDQAEIPHADGIGAVYINQVEVSFEGNITFRDNCGTGLAAAGTSLNLSDSSITFFNNSGYRGGALALLGSAFIIINDNTNLSFESNKAYDKGGAIFNRYVEMDNLKTHFNCFIRHTNPLYKPDEWGSVFNFTNNTDHNSWRRNSIHTTSVLPCAWAGGNGYVANIDEIFCWNNWSYKYNQSENNSLVRDECCKQITSGPGLVNLLSNQSRAVARAIPGHNFALPFNITDDFGKSLTEETIFSSMNVVTKVGSGKYFWNGTASLSGQEKTNVTLQLESLGDIIWQVDMLVDFARCPPGLYPEETEINNDTVCTCTTASMYHGILSCDPYSYSVTMRDQNWIGYVHKYKKYLVSLCPRGFCTTTRSSMVTLPSSPSKLNDIVCAANRTGIMCGMCVDGHGPAVNSLTFDCVVCSNATSPTNVVKYMSSTYLPLALLFTILILFDIRLTTGPANAFILFSQVITTTYVLDAYGQIPFNNITHNSYDKLEKGYKTIYGIFNLEFIENLIKPFCLNSKFSTLTVLALDYGVAFFPLVMIVVVVLCLKLKDCCCSSRNVRVSRVSRKLFKSWRRGNLTEALLPSFAAFILLSYTKFSLVSSYLLSLQPLINQDGNPEKPYRVYFAGHLTLKNEHYLHSYYIPAIFVSAIMLLIPLLLLLYPLEIFEWCLSKIKFLWKFYPIDKIHFFLDTFQGCYRRKMRFFPGLYFMFRWMVNTTYLVTETWLQQFVVQQIACIVMVVLIAVCQPYKRTFLNYVDLLIFADLAILNGLSLYLFTASRNNQTPHLAIFVIQYILVLLPLVYMLIYIVGKVLQKQKWLNTKLDLVTAKFKRTKYTPLNMMSAAEENDDREGPTHNEFVVSQREDEALFERAEVPNSYCRINAVHGDIDSESNDSRGGQNDERGRSSGIASHSLSHNSRSAGYGTMSSNDS